MTVTELVTELYRLKVSDDTDIVVKHTCNCMGMSTPVNVTFNGIDVVIEY